MKQISQSINSPSQFMTIVVC